LELLVTGKVSKMRWKWLLVLSLLITLSTLSVNGNDDDGDEEKVAEDVNNDQNVEEDDQVYDDEVVDESVKEEEEKDPVDDPGEIISAIKAEESTNEDTVDVDVVSKDKQRGNLYNYEDYIASNLDTSDNNYNWNGE
jgi:hypothetical protein